MMRSQQASAVTTAASKHHQRLSSHVTFNNGNVSQMLESAQKSDNASTSKQIGVISENQSPDKYPEELVKSLSFQDRMKFFNSVYSGGFSQNLSTNTLRNETLAFSFPKGPRMLNPPEFVIKHNSQILAKESGERSQSPLKNQPSSVNLKQLSGPSFYDLPSTLKQNSTSFGIGDKKASYIFLRGTPSPNHYQIKRMYEHHEDLQKVNKATGRDLNQCTFGLPHEKYRKALVIVNEANTPLNQKRLIVSTPGLQDRRRPSTVSETIGTDSPGPAAQYKLRSSLKQRQLSFGRKDFMQASFLSELEVAQRNVPPPATYQAKYDLVEPSRYKGITQGYGMKMDPLLLLSSHKMQISPERNPPMYIQVPESQVRTNPGPGQYRIPSKFDKYQGMDIIAKKLIKKLEKLGEGIPKKNKKRNKSDLIRDTYEFRLPAQVKTQKKIKIKRAKSSAQTPSNMPYGFRTVTTQSATTHEHFMSGPPQQVSFMLNTASNENFGGGDKYFSTFKSRFDTSTVASPPETLGVQSQQI